MLALPLYPTSIAPHQSPETVSQYRPAKDVESFNKLLPPAVEFVEGSSSGTLLIGEGRYDPVNGSPKSSSGPEVCPLSHRFVSSHQPRLGTGTCPDASNRTPGSRSPVTVFPCWKEGHRSLFCLCGNLLAQRIDRGLWADQHGQ